MTTWIVLGAGYTGGRLARALRDRGDAVTVTRRTHGDATATARALGVDAAPLDLGADEGPAQLAALLTQGAIVVHSAPPIDGDGRGEARLATAAAHAGVARVVYLSSTGVYAPAAGAWVDEDFALAPTTASGRARLAAERALTAGLVPCVRLRVAGIYGPGRGVLARMRAGSYRLIGDGASAVSRIHVDDLVTAILAAGDAANPGPVYNIADDAPCSSAELARAAATRLGLPQPPSVPLASVDPEVAGMLTADRRIDSRRLQRELGVRWRYPSWTDAVDVS